MFKLVTFSAALQDGADQPEHRRSRVPDQIELDGSTFHDAEPHPPSELTATQILAQSSNIGTSEIAAALGETRLLAQVQTLGFGQPTGLDFPGESPGLLATAAQWEPTDIVSLPIGQVDAVTAQQVLDAYNAVANGGRVRRPRAGPGHGRRRRHGRPPRHASATHRVIPPTTDAELTTMLEQVVAKGTGTSAVMPGYTVAGQDRHGPDPDRRAARLHPGRVHGHLRRLRPGRQPGAVGDRRARTARRPSSAARSPRRCSPRS